MTPLELEVLIHCYVTPELHPRIHAPAVKEAHEFFEEIGLIEQQKDFYSTTDRGKAYISMLCSLPLPEQKWVNQFGEIIEI